MIIGLPSINQPQTQQTPAPRDSSPNDGEMASTFANLIDVAQPAQVTEEDGGRKRQWPDQPDDAGSADTARPVTVPLAAQPLPTPAIMAFAMGQHKLDEAPADAAPPAEPHLERVAALSSIEGPGLDQQLSQASPVGPASVSAAGRSPAGLQISAADRLASAETARGGDAVAEIQQKPINDFAEFVRAAHRSTASSASMITSPVVPNATVAPVATAASTPTATIIPASGSSSGIAKVTLPRGDMRRAEPSFSGAIVRDIGLERYLAPALASGRAIEAVLSKTNVGQGQDAVPELNAAIPSGGANAVEERPVETQIADVIREAAASLTQAGRDVRPPASPQSLQGAAPSESGFDLNSDPSGVVKSLRISLHPVELGHVDVRLTMVSGQLRVHLRFAQAEAARAVEGRRDELREVLGSSDIVIDGLGAANRTRALPIVESVPQGSSLQSSTYAGGGNGAGASDGGRGQRHNNASPGSGAAPATTAPDKSGGSSVRTHNAALIV